MKGFIRYSLAAAGLLLLLPSCKPTERNYQAAYDAAINKRNKDNTVDPDLLPAGAFKKAGEPELKELGGLNVLWMMLRVRPYEGQPEKRYTYNVAVACYKMPTNCSAQVSDLQEAGYAAYGVKTGDDRYYVMAAGFDNPQEAAAFADKYAKGHEPRTFVGLPGAPVLIQNL